MKITKVVTILMVLLLCLSFTVGAAEQTKIKTQDDIVKDMVKNKDFTRFQKAHDHTKFDRAVAGNIDIKMMSSKHKVPNGFEVQEDGYQTMVAFKKNGKIVIRDTEHKVETLQIPWSDITSLDGWNGESVLIRHYNDYGVMDGIWVQQVHNDNGYAYLEDVPFSEVIVDGFVGTYTKVDTYITPEDTINLGQTYDSDDVNYINITIDDQYADKTGPYDINTTGLVAWYRFDDAGSTVIDYSGNGNNGTFTAATYTNGKYNNGGDFDSVDDMVTVPDSESLNTTALTAIYWINADSLTSNNWLGGKVGVFDTPRAGWLVLVSATQYKFLANSTGGQIDTSVNHNLNPGNLVQVEFNFDGDRVKIYENNILLIDKDVPDGNIVLTSNNFQINLDSVNGFDGMIDEVLIYNESISDDKRNEIYFAKTSSLQAKTNSNATYSTEWNSSADNPLSVPFGASESISSLTFNTTGPIVQDGVTVYDPVNMLFNTSVEVGYTENTTNIYEEVNGDSYQIFIQHIPGLNSTTGTVSFTSDPNAILSSPYLTTGMDTNNTNASMSYNDVTREWTVTTGPLVAGQEYNYVLYGVLEGSVLEEVVEGGFGSDNMHAYTAIGNDTVIVGSAFRAAYGDSVWGNQSNDLWEDAGAMIALAALMLVVGIVLVSIRRYRA
jgi:hypothetical protein